MGRGQEGFFLKNMLHGGDLIKLIEWGCMYMNEKNTEHGSLTSKDAFRRLRNVPFLSAPYLMEQP